MMMCQDTKALFHQRQRITVLTAGIFKNQGSRKVTNVWLAQVKNFMHNQLGTFQPILSNTASESIKGPIREALTHQNKMGAKLNLQGYMSIKWREALGQQAGEINETSIKSKIWAKTAISHLWKLAQGAWKAQNNKLHKEKHTDLAQSAQKEKICQIYTILQSKISSRDKYIFNTDLGPILTEIQKSKKCCSAQFFVSHISG